MTAPVIGVSQQMKEQMQEMGGMTGVTHRWLLPLIVTGDGWTSTLHLTSASDVAEGATLVIRKADGSTVKRFRVSVPASKSIEVSLGSYLDNENASFVFIGNLLVIQEVSTHKAAFGGRARLLRTFTNGRATSGPITEPLDEVPDILPTSTPNSTIETAPGELLAITSINQGLQDMTLWCVSRTNQAESTLVMAPRQTVVLRDCRAVDPVALSESSEHSRPEMSGPMRLSFSLGATFRSFQIPEAYLRQKTLRDDPIGPSSAH